MAREELVLGSLGSQIAMMAFAHFTKEVRRSGMDHVLNYQHRDPELESIAFTDVYNPNPEVAKAAIGRINWNPATTPEDHVPWEIDKIVIVEDNRREELNPVIRANPVTWAKVVAIVIARVYLEHSGWKTRRMRATLDYSNNQVYTQVWKRTVEDIDLNQETPAIVAQILEIEGELATA